MIPMNVSKWIKDIIASDKSLSMPIMTHPGIELLGKKVLDAVIDGEVHFQAIRALKERFPKVWHVLLLWHPDCRSRSFRGINSV